MYGKSGTAAKRSLPEQMSSGDAEPVPTATPVVITTGTLEVSPTVTPTPTPKPTPTPTPKPTPTPTPTSSPSMADWVLGGDGPGACGLPATDTNTCRNGQTPIACPSGYSETTSFGDCYITPNYGPQCLGNRPLCVKAGKDVRPVVGLRLFNSGACPEGWESLSSNVGLTRGHVYGIVTGPYTNPANYKEAVWCKQTKDIGALLPSDPVLKNVGVLGTSLHLTTPPGCPTGYQEAGLIPDCSNLTGDKNIQWCQGLIRVCTYFK